MGRRSLLPGVFKVFGVQGATLSHFKGVGITFTKSFWALWSSRCKPIALWGGWDRFYLAFLRFVDFKVQPYRTLRGSGSLLPRLFAVCGIPGAPLSHFGGVEITFTLFLLRFVEFKVQPSHTLEGSASLLLSLLEVCGTQAATPSNFLQIYENKETFMVWCNPIALWGGQGHFYLVFLRFVEFRVHPYHTLEGSGSVLLSNLSRPGDFTQAFSLKVQKSPCISKKNLKN